MKRQLLRVLRRFMFVTMVPLGVLGFVGYLADTQDLKEIGAIVWAATTTIPPNNPLQVAILRWYPANLTTSFGVGSNPNAVAFDGANVWVANAAATP
jgi:hypothetical protein